MSLNPIHAVSAANVIRAAGSKVAELGESFAEVFAAQGSDGASITQSAEAGDGVERLGEVLRELLSDHGAGAEQLTFTLVGEHIHVDGEPSLDAGLQDAIESHEEFLTLLGDYLRTQEPPQWSVLTDEL